MSATNRVKQIAAILEESGVKLVFKDPPYTKTYFNVTDHGVDGNGFTVYSGMSDKGFPSVLIVNEKRLMAESVNDGSCKTLPQAGAKADWAVENNITRYWDSKNPMERYTNHSRRPPVLSHL